MGEIAIMDSDKFLKSVLDTITQHVCAIDRNGNIIYVNKSWIAFGENNSSSMHKGWDKANYLQECDNSASKGDKDAIMAAKGIRDVINKVKDCYYLEYPCHSPNEKRWFMMRVTPFEFEDKEYCVISHEIITERKLIEEQTLSLSRIDGLTDIANRRYFDDFLENEWRRCVRSKMPISLAIIDLDQFKLLNDTYGHQAGDECLKKVGSVLKTFAKRPTDLCARYGGEEFAVILGDTTLKNSLSIMNNLLDAIRQLKIPNKNSSVMPTLTASIGLATLYPHACENKEELMAAADKMLYRAKENGRNYVAYENK